MTEKGGFVTGITAVQVAQAANGEQSAFFVASSACDEAISSSLQLSQRQQGTTVSISTTSDNMNASNSFTVANLV